MGDSFISNDPNIISDLNPESDPNIISEVEFGDIFHAPVGEGSDPKAVPGYVPGSDPLLGPGYFIADDIEGSSNNPPMEKSSQAKRAKLSGKGAGETLDWLPAGWKVIRKTRSNGVTAGTVDTYYEDRAGQRYRSKVEVKRFLETGSKNKPQSDANATTTTRDKEKSGNKETGTESKKEARLNFDFADTPEEVTWSLGDVTWKPSIGGEPVPEETVQEWAATFELGCKMD